MSAFQLAHLGACELVFRGTSDTLDLFINHTLCVLLKESGATPLIQIRNGSTALSRDVMQHTTVKEVIRWVSVMLES